MKTQRLADKGLVMNGVPSASSFPLAFFFGQQKRNGDGDVTMLMCRAEDEHENRSAVPRFQVLLLLLLLLPMPSNVS